MGKVRRGGYVLCGGLAIIRRATFMCSTKMAG